MNLNFRWFVLISIKNIIFLLFIFQLSVSFVSAIPTKAEFESLEKWKLIETIDHGEANERVEIKQYLETGELFAFKFMNGRFDKQEKNAFEKLKGCNDKRIKKSIEELNIGNKIVYVSEFAPGGSIQNYADSISKCTYKEKFIKALKLIRQLYDISLILSEYGIVHKDMSQWGVGNLFVNEENGEPVLYVIDFSWYGDPVKDCVIANTTVESTLGIEHRIFDATQSINESGEPVYNLKEIQFNRQCYQNLVRLFENDEDRTIRFRNSMFAIFFDVLFGSKCFNPLITGDGCMSLEEINKLLNNGKGGYLEKNDPEVVRRLIDYIDKKVPDISKMSDKEAEKICPIIEINKQNVGYYVNKLIFALQEYEEKISSFRNI